MIESTGFMTALEDATQRKQPKLVKPKSKTTTTQSGASPAVKTTSNTMTMVCFLIDLTVSFTLICVFQGGLYSDTTKVIRGGGMTDTATPSPPPSSSSAITDVSASALSTSTKRRRVRFSDEHGGELVETRFFEIEEGERGMFVVVKIFI
jgi:hypothetical protein